MARRVLGLAELQAVQRARARQCIPAVALAFALLPGQVPLAYQQRHQRITSQLPMVVEVFVAQRQRIDALRHQCVHIVFHTQPIAVIDKTPRQPGRQSDALVHFAQHYPARVGTEPSTVKSPRHRTTSQGVKLQLLAATLCLQGCFLVAWPNSLIPQLLCHEEQPFSTPSVKFAG